MSNDEPYVHVATVARVTGFTQQTLRKWKRQGKIAWRHQTGKHGPELYLSVSDLQALGIWESSLTPTPMKSKRPTVESTTDLMALVDLLIQAERRATRAELELEQIRDALKVRGINL